MRWLHELNETVVRTDRIDFRQLVLGAISQFPTDRTVRVLDVGGGKAPFLKPDEIPENVAYVLSDISQTELDGAPDFYRQKRCFDICGGIPSDLGEFDVIFSRMLAEHVPSGERMYKNLFGLLSPNGIALNYHPTLFALPFVINKLMPHRFAKRVVQLMHPWRRVRDSVFPAHYDWCTSLSFEIERRRRIGFADVEIVRRYGNEYWGRVPVVRDLQRIMVSLSRRREWALFSSYAVFVCRRG